MNDNNTPRDGADHPGDIQVLVRDLFHGDGSEDFVLSGFPDFATAREYARRRTRASFEETRKPGQTAEQLLSQWRGFGELVTVLGEPGYTPETEIENWWTLPAFGDQTDHLSIRRRLGDTLRMISFSRED